MSLYSGQMAQKNIYQSVLKTIGAEDMVKEPINRDYDIIHVIRKGLYMKNLLKLAQQMSLSLKEISAILPVSERTLKRYRSTTRLSPELSERLLKLSHLYNKGLEVFGNKDSFIIWLNSELLALGGNKPIEILDTQNGIEMAVNILGRIEHGIYS
ncbi:MAG: DUF2384 domain-containing protein [Ignavibacteriae bacterium]|nr:MAG: DUF2384 domain-containing protein [Ignavibacteriota bacterium]